MSRFHAFNFPDANSLHDGLTERLLFASAEELDDYNSVDVQMHNVLAHTPTFDWDYDISRLWTTRARWNTMVRQYINPDDFLEWLKAIENGPSSRRGVAVLRTNTVKARESGRGKTRRWGSCMLTLSFRQKPWPQITLHSRTCYLGYLSCLDMTVAHVAARHVGALMGIPVEEMSFVWQLEMAQFHGFRTIAYPLGGSDELYQRYLNHETEGYPGVKLSRTWHDRITQLDKDGVKYGDMKFASYRRVRARWHTQVYGLEYAKQFEGGTYNPRLGKVYHPIPETRTNDLDFSPIGIPGP